MQLGANFAKIDVEVEGDDCSRDVRDKLSLDEHQFCLKTVVLFQ